MNFGTATFPSILDKPLNQLTDDDISQLTREDCRKFLKEKGMRRPSWNKSQAIQQVISLKALLGPADDDSGAIRKIAFFSAQEDTPPGNSKLDVATDVPEVDASVSAGLAEDPALQAGAEIQKSVENPTGDETTEKVVSLRGCTTRGLIGQMTIFYCGKVNVYDGLPHDKARTIMQLAASPIHSPLNSPFSRSTDVWPSHCHLQMNEDYIVPIDTAFPQISQADKMVEYPLKYWEKASNAWVADGMLSRKVLLQRYFEKRKDRGRIKSKKFTGITSSKLGMFLDHQVKAHASYENSSHCSTSSPPEARLPQASSGSGDNQPKIALPFDLNDNDALEFQDIRLWLTEERRR